MIPVTIFTLIGLAFNIVGTFLMACSVKYPHKMRYEIDAETPDILGDVVKFKRKLFRCGLCILGLGFFLQLTGIILELICN